MKDRRLELDSGAGSRGDGGEDRSLSAVGNVFILQWCFQLGFGFRF